MASNKMKKRQKDTLVGIKVNRNSEVINLKDSLSRSTSIVGDRTPTEENDSVSLSGDYYYYKNNQSVDMSDILKFDNKKDLIGEYQVDCGSREKILENLLGLNPIYVTVFFDTYILFMTSMELFDFLVDQYQQNIVLELRNRGLTLSSLNSVMIPNNESFPIEMGETNSSLSGNITSANSKESFQPKEGSSNNEDSCSTRQDDRRHTILSTSSMKSESLTTGSGVTSNITNTITVENTSRIASLKLLRKWVGSYFEDFVNDQELVEKLKKFLKTAEGSAENNSRLWRTINLVSITLSNMEQAQVSGACNSDNIEEKNVSWDVLKHGEVADALTFIEHLLFKQLNMRELLWYVFERSPDRKTRCPSVVRLIENSTRLTYLVETQIVKYPNARIRAVEMETWISVLADLMAVKNYSSMVTILAALNTTSIDRLQKTKKKVSPKKMKIKADIEKELGTSNYYDNLRVYLDNNVHINALPFLGSYMTILDRLKQTGVFVQNDKINFKTCRHISKLIQSIKTRQKSFVCKKMDEKKISYMKKILLSPSLSAQEIAKLSHKHEPRES